MTDKPGQGQEVPVLAVGGARQATRGQRFRHARFLAPEGSKANAVKLVCVVTAARRGEVFYTSAAAWDSGEHKGRWYTGAEQFERATAREWI